MKENSFPGRFIVIEGADGAGTTTVAEHIAEKKDFHYTYEPSGNSIGEKVDELISSDSYSPESIALGFAADRMVHLEEEIIPRLENGETVVCDRYYHSSLVYQTAMGLDFEWVRSLNQAALRPDLTIVLDVSAEIGIERVDERGRDGNIFEEMEFQEKVVRRYRNLKEQLDERIELVDASRSKEEVKTDVEGKIDRME